MSKHIPTIIMKIKDPAIFAYPKERTLTRASISKIIKPIINKKWNLWQPDS